MSKFEFLHLHILTPPSQRFGIFGQLGRHGVRSIICTNHAGRADVQTVPQSPTFTFWCVPQDQPFRRIPNGTCHATDRIGPFSPCTNSGTSMPSVTRKIQRSVWGNKPSPSSKLLLSPLRKLNLSTGFVRSGRRLSSMTVPC